MVVSSSGKQGMRSFTVVEVSKHGGCKTKFNAGRYISRNPVGAAKKAFNSFCRVKKIRGVCTLVVTVRETTSGSKGKAFSYKLHRRKLKEPMIMLEGSPNEFVIEYTVDAKSVDVPMACKKPGQTRGRRARKTKRKSKLSPNNVRKLKSKKTSKKNNSKKNNSKKTKLRRSKRIAAKSVRKSPRNLGKNNGFFSQYF